MQLNLVVHLPFCPSLLPVPEMAESEIKKIQEELLEVIGFYDELNQ